jgi:hypothetical protein
MISDFQRTLKEISSVSDRIGSCLIHSLFFIIIIIIFTVNTIITMLHGGYPEFAPSKFSFPYLGNIELHSLSITLLAYRYIFRQNVPNIFVKTVLNRFYMNSLKEILILH